MIFVRMIFSRVLAIGERREIGLYEVKRWMSLSGFGIGVMFAVFQMQGMIFVLTERV